MTKKKTKSLIPHLREHFGSAVLARKPLSIDKKEEESSSKASSSEPFIYRGPELPKQQPYQRLRVMKRDLNTLHVYWTPKADNNVSHWKIKTFNDANSPLSELELSGSSLNTYIDVPTEQVNTLALYEKSESEPWKLYASLSFKTKKKEIHQKNLLGQWIEWSPKKSFMDQQIIEPPQFTGSWPEYSQKNISKEKDETSKQVGYTGVSSDSLQR